MLKKLYKIVNAFEKLSELDNEKLIKNILNITKNIMECQASSIIELDKNYLIFSTISGGSKKIKQLKLKKEEGIAGYVVKNKKPVIVNDVKKSKIWAKRADQFTKFKTTSLIAQPLIIKDEITSEKIVIGVIESLNKKTGFNKEDLKIFKLLATQISLALKNSRLYNQAVFDKLTNIFNRQYWDVWLKREFHRSLRYKNDLSLIMFDIDHFKKFNDTYGHKVGDLVLQKVSKKVFEMIRESDVFARFGGEEFIIALPETKFEETKKIAEQIRKSVQNMEIHNNSKKLKVTISIGFCNIKRNNPQTVEEFLKQADKALYFSKEHGRNISTGYNIKL